MTTAGTAEATKTRTATEIPPALPDALRSQLGADLAAWLEARCAVDGGIALRRFVGLRVYQGHGRKATAIVLARVFLSLQSGPRLLNVSQIARQAGVSRPTAYRALRFVAAPTIGRPKLVRLDPRATGPRRPGWWEIRPDIFENVSLQRAQEKAASSSSVSPNDSIESEKTTSKPQGQGPKFSGDSLPLMGRCAPRREAPPAQTTDPKAILAWLDSPSLDLDRAPTFSERRKLAAALRLAEDVNCDVASATLDALFWRRSAPLRVWKTAILALVNAGDRFLRPRPPRRYELGVIVPPEHWSKQPPRELAWRARLGLKILTADPAAVTAFLVAVERGTVPEDSEPAAVQEHVKRIEAQVRDIYAAADVRGTCPLCGKLIKLGPLPTVDEAKRVDDSFAFQVLRTIPEWRETAPGEKRKRTQFVRDNYRTWARFGPSVFVEHTGPHLCAVTLVTKRHFLKQELKGVRC